MVNDTEPRYRLVDADGNVVGSLFAENDGTLKLQEGTSGSDNEVSVATDGTFNAPAVSTDSGTIDGSDTLDGTPSSSSDETGLGFDSWRTPSTDRPTGIIVSARAETDGSTKGSVVFYIDEDGGTTRDYNIVIAEAPTGIGSGGEMTDEITMTLPPGASYQVRNSADPNGNNSLFDIREFDR